MASVVKKALASGGYLSDKFDGWAFDAKTGQAFKVDDECSQRAGAIEADTNLLLKRLDDLRVPDRISDRVSGRVPLSWPDLDPTIDLSIVDKLSDMVEAYVPPQHIWDELMESLPQNVRISMRESMKLDESIPVSRSSVGLRMSSRVIQLDDTRVVQIRDLPVEPSRQMEVARSNKDAVLIDLGTDTCTTIGEIPSASVLFARNASDLGTSPTFRTADSIDIYDVGGNKIDRQDAIVTAAFDSTLLHETGDDADSTRMSTRSAGHMVRGLMKLMRKTISENHSGMVCADLSPVNIVFKKETPDFYIRQWDVVAEPVQGKSTWHLLRTAQWLYFLQGAVSDTPTAFYEMSVVNHVARYLYNTGNTEEVKLWGKWAQSIAADYANQWEEGASFRLVDRRTGAIDEYLLPAIDYHLFDNRRFQAE